MADAQHGGTRPGAGRPKRLGPAPGRSISIWLTETEIQELDAIVAHLKLADPDANRGAALRFVLANPWLLGLTGTQLATLRSKAGAGHGD